MGKQPGTFKVHEVRFPDGDVVGDTRINARYVLAVTKLEGGGTGIRMHGSSEHIFSDEDAGVIFKRWQECK